MSRTDCSFQQIHEGLEREISTPAYAPLGRMAPRDVNPEAFFQSWDLGTENRQSRDFLDTADTG